VYSGLVHGGDAYDVFLSYSRADVAAAEKLRSRLKEAGLNPFLDRYGLPAGQPWQPWLEQHIGSCRALVALVGPLSFGEWQHREIELGLHRQASAKNSGRQFPVVPVLLPGLANDALPVGSFLSLNTWVDLRSGLDDPQSIQRLIAGAQGQAIDAAAAEKLLPALTPYRGLLPFREQDAGLFFGRERFVKELVQKVGQRAAMNVVAVIGRSGSGKSSIVYAGLFPALRRERGRGDQSVWQILHLRPDVEPLHQLAFAFDPPKAEPRSIAFRAQLNESAKFFRDRQIRLADLVRDRLRDEPGSTRLLLYVDQWEELYTQAAPREPKSDKDRARTADVRLFVDLVLDAASSSDCTLVLSVRSDFYPDIQLHDDLRKAVQNSQVSLGSMNKQELEAAIEGPPKALGAGVDPNLTDKLIRDIGLDPASSRSDEYDIGKLPLLEYALEQAWKNRTGPQIGTAEYAGLEQALEARANAVFDKLSAEEQAAAKRLFVSLVTPGEGHEDTRARIAMPDDGAMRSVIQTFAGTDARLIVTDEAAGRRSVEFSHEALIRHWDKLRAWVNENRENLRIREFLRAYRDEWLKHGRDPSLLDLPRLHLEAARRLRDQPGDVVVDEIRDYVDAALERQRKRQEAEETKQRQELENQRHIAMAIQRQLDRANAALAEAINSDLGWDPDQILTLTARQRNALWRLAVADDAVKGDYVGILTGSPGETVRAAPGFAQISRALGLLRRSPAEAESLVGAAINAVLAQRDSDLSYSIGDICDPLVAEIRALAPNLTAWQVQAAFDLLLEQISQPTCPDLLQRLAEAMQALAAQLTEAQALAALDIITRQINQAPDAPVLGALAQAVQSLRVKSTEAQAQLALDDVLKQVEQTTERGAFAVLARALQGWAPNLSALRAKQALSRVLDRIGRAQDSDVGATQALIPTFKALAPRLAPAQAQQALYEALEEIEKGSDVFNLYTLTEAVRELAAVLPKPRAQQALDYMREQIGRTTDPWILQTLYRGLEALPAKLTEAEASQALDAAFKNFEETKGYDLASLANVMAVLPARLNEAQQKRVLDKIWQQIVGPRAGNDYAVSAYSAKALGRLAPKLSDPNVLKHAFDLVLNLLAQPQDSIVIVSLGVVLRASASGLTETQAQQALRPVLEQIDQATNPELLQALALALQGLAPKLAEIQARDASVVANSSLAWAANEEEAAAWARVLMALVDRSAQPNATKELAAAIAYPMAAGEPTDALLDAIRARAPDTPAKAAGTDAALEWLAGRYPEILHPICPPPPQPYGISKLKCPVVEAEAAASAAAPVEVK
jgi:hypothetical protein